MPTTTEPSTRQLPIDLNFWCHTKYGPGASAVVRQPTAYGWVCVANGRDWPIDVAEAARMEYGPNAMVAYRDWNDAYSWYAYVPQAPEPPPDNGVIDLKPTPVGAQLLEYLKRFAQGNEGDAGIDTLSLDLGTGEARGQVWVRSRQHSGNVPITGTPIILYDWTVSGTVCVNVRCQVSGSLDLGNGVVLDLATIANILAAAG